MTGRFNLWLLILVAVCGASFWFGKDWVVGREPSAAAESPEILSVADFQLAPEEAPIHLVVLNGTERAGLAREVSLLLGRAGCVAESVGNAPHLEFASSVLVNRRLAAKKAAELARRLGGIRVVREWDGRESEDAVLVLGRDWAHLVGTLEKATESGG